MNLFVSNLNLETKDVDLRNLFSEFGTVVAAKVVKDMITGDSRGFGFVEMGDKYTADNAIDNLDSTYLHGNIIVVKPAKQNTAKPSSSARKPYPPKRYNNPPSNSPQRDEDSFNRF